MTGPTVTLAAVLWGLERMLVSEARSWALVRAALEKVPEAELRARLEQVAGRAQDHLAQEQSALRELLDLLARWPANEEAEP